MKHTLFAALVAAIVMVCPSQAATFTPVFPAPPGEVNLADIIATQGPGWERVPDNLDTTFPVPGFGSLFLLAGEDLMPGFSDDDFNDEVVLFDSIAGTFTFIAGYAGATHTWAFAGGIVEFVGAGYPNVGAFTSQSSPDRILTWGRPLDPAPVPEPASVFLLGGVLIGMAVAGRRWKRKQ